MTKGNYSVLVAFQTLKEGEGLYMAFEETQDSRHKESQSSTDLEIFISTSGGRQQAMDASA